MPGLFSACWSKEAAAARSAARRWLGPCRAKRIAFLSYDLVAAANAQTNFQLLFSFNAASGQGPEASLIEGTDGKLYGTAAGGGSNGFGTVFKLDKDGSGHTVLHHFAGGSNDGSYPVAGLLRGSDGALYGTTSGGGAADSGTIFKLFSASPQPVAITGIEFTAAGARLSVAGPPSQSYQIEARANLSLTSDWQTLGSNAVGANGSSQFLDADATNYPARFYRSVTP